MELFKLLGTIAIENGEAVQAIKDTTEEGNKSQSKLSKAFGAIGKGAVAVGKAVGTGMIAAGTAVAGLVTQSTQSYAEYEQLVGGVETLFKDSAKTVMEYANNAYKTAGMSANDYMTTVTSFSASLLQSLGGNTEAAAQKANLAITDMSDNANKMGTSMESIQNAYQGFAKQNYTMLDNLKLGYGGTKEEMDRLITDAMKLDSTFHANTKTVKKNGKAVEELDYTYADVVDAIHIVQTEMGITGTTAAEASGTISGSAASVKAAWTNLVTAMADDNADLGSYVDTFVNSAATSVENLIPRIGIALEGVVDLVDQLAPVIIERLPGLISSLIPSVINAATGLLNSVVAVLPSLVDMLANEAIPPLLSGFLTVINSLISALPQAISAIVSALPTLIPMLINGLTSLIVNLCTNLPLIIQPIIDNLPMLLECVTTALMSNLPVLVQGLISLFVALVPMLPQVLNILLDSILITFSEQWAGAIMELVPVLLVGIGQLILALCQSIPSALLALVKLMFAPFIQLYNGIKTFLEPMAGWFNEHLVEPIKIAIGVIASILDAAFQIITLPFQFIWENCKEYVFAAFEWIKDKIGIAVDFIKNLIQVGFSFVQEKIIQPLTAAKNKASEIFGNIQTKISDTVGKIKDKVKETFDKVKESMEKPIQDAKDTIGGIVDTIKGFFSNMKLEFPNIKLPHFSVSPSGWSVGDLLKGSIPKLSIKWYADAMNNPMIMTKPTIFGYNGATGQLLGGGEAGSEVVSGTDTLLNMISAAVAAQNEGVVHYLQMVTEILADYCPQALEAAQNPVPAIVGVDQAADALAAPINYRLGKMAIMKGRGR